MKRFLTYIISIFIASLVFYGGAGVNLVSYCCSCCEKHGIESLMESRCCKMRAHQHAEKSATNDKAFTAKNCKDNHKCGFERINFEWISDNNQTVEIEPIVHDLFFASLLHLEIIFDNNPFYEVLRITGPPVTVVPRTYLSLLTTLLI